MILVQARVVEWQTRWTQNPLPERACGFDSHLGHALRTDAMVPGGKPPGTIGLLASGEGHCLVRPRFVTGQTSKNTPISYFVRLFCRVRIGGTRVHDLDALHTRKKFGGSPS